MKWDILLVEKSESREQMWAKYCYNETELGIFMIPLPWKKINSRKACTLFAETAHIDPQLFLSSAEAEGKCYGVASSGRCPRPYREVAAR